ncbi:MAG TPA: NAD-dependent epimerase/dehydratase family protein, partial [Acidimicrobiales bacterium]|nr:NAD-dependent epimerase/dehydratase family protein [Acidimicrobiales bacterium]
MRALITGGRGFVGNWLAEHLREQGDEVVAIDLETDVADQAALDPVVADAAPDAVYHLAARTHVGESWQVPAEVLRVNVLGTAAVLAAARRLSHGPTVLVVSSAEVYGIVAPGDLPLSERSPVAPVTPYAASKAAAEQVALQAWRGYGQPVLLVRPFNHVGPGQAPSFAVSALARRIVEARRAGATELAVGTLTSRRDFTDVRDVVQSYRQLVERGVPGTIYNVCS